MGKKANKASRKYAASGQLKKEIQARKKHQQLKRTIEKRRGPKGENDSRVNSKNARNKGKGKERETPEEDEEMSDEEEEVSASKKSRK